MEILFIVLQWFVIITDFLIDLIDGLSYNFTIKSYGKLFFSFTLPSLTERILLMMTYMVRKTLLLFYFLEWKKTMFS